MKRLVAILCTAALIAALAACGNKTTTETETTAAATAPVSDVSSMEPRSAGSGEPSGETGGGIYAAATPVPTAAPTPVPTAAPTPVPTAASTAVPTPVPAPVPTAVPTPVPTPAPTPAPTAVPLRAGTYEAADGSLLTVKSSGSVSYKTEVSGTVNGAEMSAMLTFSGTMADGGFTFTKVSYGLLDLTATARANGLDDASQWEDAAWALYLDNIG